MISSVTSSSQFVSHTVGTEHCTCARVNHHNCTREKNTSNHLKICSLICKHINIYVAALLCCTKITDWWLTLHRWEYSLSALRRVSTHRCNPHHKHCYADISEYWPHANCFGIYTSFRQFYCVFVRLVWVTLVAGQAFWNDSHSKYSKAVLPTGKWKGEKKREQSVTLEHGQNRRSQILQQLESFM